MADTKEAVKTPPRTPFARRVVEVPGRRTRGSGEPKRLTVGCGISLSGEINSCDTLVVEGEVQASLDHCNTMEIAKTGVFKGAAEIATADIAGLFDGDLVVRERLILRGTGRIIGTVRYGDLEIERGGRITGTMELLPDAAETVSDTKPGA
jgi:cytoskeletal protein CcmA (bactofilin family)